MIPQNSQVLPAGTILKGKTTYSIEKFIGQGGFGITYLATGRIMDGNIPRYVQYTIKEFFIKSTCTREENGSVIYNDTNTEEVNERRKDFKKEAEHLKEIHHKNIVPVNEVIEANNTVYYVMQYLGNQSLTDYVKSNGGKLGENEAVSIISQVANAMKSLHENHRLTHLDIKPDNIMMVNSLEGLTPVLIDFGLSRHYNRRGNETHTNNVLGVSHGFSPIEQYAGIDSFSPQTDVYAIGATLLYMLTGKIPLKSTEITEQIICEMLPKNIKEQTKSTILHSMNKMPENRIQQVADFLDQLNWTPNPTPEMATQTQETDENATIIIGSKKTKKNESNKAHVSRKAIVGISLCSVAILVSLLIYNFSSSATDPENIVTEEKINVVETESVEPVAEQIVEDTTTVKESDPKAQEEVKPETQSEVRNEVQTKSNAASVKNESVTQKAGSLTLDNGMVWSGPVKDSKPNGKGTIRFTQPTTFQGEKVGPGDRVRNAVYNNGVFESGVLVQGDEEIIL